MNHPPEIKNDYNYPNGKIDYKNDLLALATRLSKENLENPEKPLEDKMPYLYRFEDLKLIGQNLVTSFRQQIAHELGIQEKSSSWIGPILLESPTDIAKVAGMNREIRGNDNIANQGQYVECYYKGDNFNSPIRFIDKFAG